MTAKLAIPFLVVLAFAACQKKEEPAAAPPADAASAAAPATDAASAPAAQAAPPATAPAPTDASASAAPVAAAPSAAAPTGGVALASQETNWPGIVADVLEFRRKGNTLTAKVRFRNQAGAEAQPDVSYKEVYVMDLAAGKKYEVLKDEKGNYIAGLRPGWSDRWYQEVPPGQSQTIWMKFPAPPAEVKTATLQVPGMPPFEDLAIQDS